MTRMISRLFILLFSLNASFLLEAQTPRAYYSFDGCSMSDSTGEFADATFEGQVNCDCGVGTNSDALYFDGGVNSATLDPNLKDVFANDFSVGFYFWADDAFNPYALISVKKDCRRDSSFYVQYLPQTDEIILEYSRNIVEGVFFREALDPANCWHHLLFIKEGNLYALYLDGRFVGSTEFVASIVLGPDYPVTLGTSPCLGITDGNFSGRIDELNFFDYALTESEIDNYLLYPDEIITPDTTIFLGDQFVVRTGSTCAPNITWQPAAGLNNTSIAQPIMSPQQTTLYDVTYDHGTCVSRDEITVSVISQDDIECDNILLPKAFTPNNDGLNDRFGISNTFAVDNLNRFEIFDRWGHKLFETNNKDETWDGSFNGETMIPGVYVYKLDYSCLGDDYKKTGSFNILK